MKQSSPNLIDYDKNISALKEVQPAPVKASEIAVRVGTSWIDKRAVETAKAEVINNKFRGGIKEMEGIWIVLSKAAVVTWLIVLLGGSILAIVSGVAEYGNQGIARNTR